MKGRKSLPDAVKQLHGTDQPCRMSDGLSVDPITDPFLKLPKKTPLKSKRAKGIFIEKANQLIAMRILTAFDIEQLSIYAYSLDQVYTCMEKLAEQGNFHEVFDDNGKVLRYVQNPYLKLLKEMIEIVNRTGSDFGFSPISRQRINQKEHEEKDPFKTLLDNL